jgi:hypothetical protein
VVQFIDRVSATVNVFLAEAGFAVPVVQNDAKLLLDDFVVVHVGALCDAVNGAGPYIPGEYNNLRGATSFEIIRKEAAEFIEAHADGLEALGASRTRGITKGLGCRTEDAGGDAIAPFFSRRQFGHSVKDWDIA